MALYAAVSVDGECVCTTCCRRVWASTYDCDTATWGAPVFQSESLEGSATSSCPADTGWYNTVGCVAEYIQYTETANICQDCGDIPQVPPATPTLPEPPGCCETCVWYKEWVWTCATSTWTLTSETRSCSFGCPNPGVFEYAACYASYCVLGPSCVDPEVNCTTATYPSMPTEPPGLPAEDCCGCCLIVWEAVFDCDTGTWDVYDTGEGAADVPCGSDTAWAEYGNSCTFRRSMYVSYAGPGSGACEYDEPAPPAYPGYGCCCCSILFEAIYDCDTETWDVNIIGSSPSVPCFGDTPWEQYGANLCVFRRTMYVPYDAASNLCDPAPDPGTPAAAPDCCPPCEACGVPGATTPQTNPQPAAAVSGYSGGCSGRNGAATAGTFIPYGYLGSTECEWGWADGDGVQIRVYFDPATGLYRALYQGVLHTTISVACVNGTLTGTATFDTSTMGCGAGTATVTFG